VRGLRHRPGVSFFLMGTWAANSGARALVGVVGPAARGTICLQSQCSAYRDPVLAVCHLPVSLRSTRDTAMRLPSPHSFMIRRVADAVELRCCV